MVVIQKLLCKIRNSGGIGAKGAGQAKFFPQPVGMDKEQGVCIPSDREQAGNDIRGKSVFDLPPGAAILRGAAACLGKLGILPAGAENGKEV